MTTTIHRRAMLGTSAAAAALAVATRLSADEPAATPVSAPPPIEAYAAPPLVNDIALSPDGKRVALITQNGDDKVLAYFDIADMKISRIKLGPVKIRNLFFADNDHVVLVNSTTTPFFGRQRELFLGRVIELKTATLKTLFSQNDDFVGMVTGDLHRIKVNGEYRVTASNLRIGGGYNFCLFSFPVDAARGHELVEGSNDTESFVIQPDGTPVAYSDFDDSRDEWVLYYNVAPPGKSTSFKPIYRVKQALDTPTLEGLGRDGKSVVVYVYTGEAGGQYHEISADGTLSEPLDSDNDGKKGSDAVFHPTTFRLIGFQRHIDWFSCDYFDPVFKKLAAALPEAMGEDYRTRMTDYAEDPRKMIVYGEGTQDAGSYFFIDFSSGNVAPLASNYSAIPEEWISEKKAIVYKAADGLEIHGYLTLPPRKGDKNLPLVVLPHGGPWARDYIDFDWQAQVLASRGYAVLQPNFRGSSGYTKAFLDAGRGEMGRKMQTDLSDGVRYLADLGTIDPKRVAILGASYGGYAAMAGATLDPGVYRCAVAIAGLSDIKMWVDSLVEKYGTRTDAGVMYWTRFLGDKERYDDISPARQAASASCPVLLIHGTDDTVVPIEQSRRMERAMKAAGKPVEFVTYKGQDHWETVGSSRIEMMKAAMAFLDKHNPA